MTTFNRSTSRRLKKLQQIPSIWEGDRRPLSSSPYNQYDADTRGECILWVDGSQGIVRGMDIVAKDAGPEAIVRTLMRSMENPHNPAKPARPQKIVVKDREIQFYLRGVLQDLDISIDYAPELPLIDELFRGFSEILDNQIPDLPPQYAQSLREKAFAIWQAAPWEFIQEQQIISLEINKWDVGTLYASIMGMLGMEYGILLYRSEDSLRQFRTNVLRSEGSQQHLEEAFLKQDCLFLTFERIDHDELEDLASLPLSAIEPTFGNIHPLEGLRSVLYEEEALVVSIALEALQRFFREQRRRFNTKQFPQINRRYRIALPYKEKGEIESVNLSITTMPQLAKELEAMTDLATEDELGMPNMPMMQSLRSDLIPENSFLSLDMISWDMLEYLHSKVNCQKVQEISQVGDGFPVILVQTSRPKAKTMIESIEQAGGLKAVCFNSGVNSWDGESYDLGLLQTGNNELFLFGEFLEAEPAHIAARKKWNRRCEKTQGYCGVIIARGFTGASSGNPQPKDMMALFEVQSLTLEDLKLGTLHLMPEL
ncbi:MAG: hypothetical protein HRU34_22630 [Richelia sp.]|nr:hypothetical protein [Richelia sp.]